MYLRSTLERYVEKVITPDEHLRLALVVAALPFEDIELDTRDKVKATISGTLTVVSKQILEEVLTAEGLQQHIEKIRARETMISPVGDLLALLNFEQRAASSDVLSPQ